MLYRHLIDQCFNPQLKVTRSEIEKRIAALEPAWQELVGRNHKAASPLLRLPAQTADLASIEMLAAHIRQHFTDVIVAGTGGSGLSGRTLVELQPSVARPRFYFLENIDPDAMDAALAATNPERTAFLIISKSGSTAETLSQFYVLLDHVIHTLGKDAAKERFFVITMPTASPLRDSAKEHGLTLLDHATDIGGRFSILTNVGLLPAAIAGLDSKALRRGAQTVIDQMDKAAGAAGCWPAMGAALQIAFFEHGFPISVMLPYCERLSGFSDWYRQCWSESLGKNGKGSTPVRAIGTTDQHSQLQLYLDGPKDKLFTMVFLDRQKQGRKIAAPNLPDLQYLQGKTLGDVMAAEQKATFETLIGNHCPVRLFTLERLKEEEMGALLMHIMLEIIFAGALLGVNPFDQPAVEQGKKLAREYLLKDNL